MRRIAALLAIALLPRVRLHGRRRGSDSRPGRRATAGRRPDRSRCGRAADPETSSGSWSIGRVRGTLRATVDCIEMAQTDQFMVATMTVSSSAATSRRPEATSSSWSGSGARRRRGRRLVGRAQCPVESTVPQGLHSGRTSRSTRSSPGGSPSPRRSASAGSGPDPAARELAEREDSNPRGLRLAVFQDRRHQPLGHRSVGQPTRTASGRRALRRPRPRRVDALPGSGRARGSARRRGGAMTDRACPTRRTGTPADR